MGKLRMETRTDLMDPERYRYWKDVLGNAAESAEGNQVFYDLEKNEKIGVVWREITTVIQQEKLEIRVRRLRKSHAIELVFGRVREVRRTRIPPEAYKKRVVSALQKSGRAMKRSEIIAETGLPVTTWSLRINELIQSGKVVRSGNKSNSTYALA